MSSVLEKAKKFKSFFNEIASGDLFFSLRSSPVIFASILIFFLMILGAVFAPWIASVNPFDPGQIFISDARYPPTWEQGGDPRFLLGTDDLGRDVFSAILYGLRISFVIGGLGVFLALLIGVPLGLIAGYAGGRIDAFIMRAADVQLTFPAILIAMMIDGVARSIFGDENRADVASIVIIVSIGLSFWVQYARTIRSATLVEKSKDYVKAARVMRVGHLAILLRHILPNVAGPMLVIGTINFGLAIITEATLSFLGVGLPPTEPSLGMLINVGQRYLFSGEWWLVTFPGVVLGLLALSVNLIGDWLRDLINPKLR